VNIDNIEAFVYVIHCGSFNKAAELLYLSQPSVTARIQSLERELNCKLFDRVGKQVQLTEEGKRFLPYAHQVLQVIQKGKQHIQQRKTITHEIRIGCTVSAANYIISDVLARMKLKQPDITYRLFTGTTDDIVNRLLNKEIDLGFVRKVTHPQIQSALIYEDRIRLYVGEGHPFIKCSKLSIDALCDQSLVFFECGSLDWLRIHRVFESLDRPPNIEFQVDNSETAKKLVLSGVGVCFLPGRSVLTEVKENKLFPIDFDEIAGLALQTHLISLNEEATELFDDVLAVCKDLKL
jgi:DNA-binding transcriptional LysR family regulator